MAHSVLALNGPNLNLLGAREPEIYGRASLAEIGAAAAARAGERGLRLDWRQSNHEGELIGWVHEALTGFDALIVNFGAYTHTSIALHDALRAFSGPIVEVHLSNLAKREGFRQHSYVAAVATGTIAGFGGQGYLLAVDAIAAHLTGARPS